ncbi:TetR/AcrR family transcriptional regulator [Paractinoplanes durhamensis]|uniref:TetR family transcriptional regulator n=1 Tax=Paractinoplanes durhamensis TaxID=113563 RepID=A0ABQ3YQJ7_9ACTN|nr:TetR family transcriptional regulator [Actinoplanes durhamensis]GID99811.1 TetR family transcriptional regulator [Actinoplanes durhamensis]
MKPTASLADRKRQVVVDELTEAALQTMAVKGFETTTVDEIVAVAGVSRRTFFRYFASKEDVLVQLLAYLGDLMQATVAAHPADEPASAALLEALAAAIEDCRDSRDKALRVVRLVLATPPLLARFLERQSQWQSGLAASLVARGADPFHADLSAGIALAAFVAVLRRWAEADEPEDPIALLDRAFIQIAPAL